jgi:hypothetical protein
MKPLTPAEIARARLIAQNNIPLTDPVDQLLMERFIAQFSPPATASPGLLSPKDAASIAVPGRGDYGPKLLMGDSVTDEPAPVLNYPQLVPQGLPSYEEPPPGSDFGPGLNMGTNVTPPAPPQGFKAQHLIGAGAAPPEATGDNLMETLRKLFSANPIPGPDAAYDQPYVAPPPKPPVIPGMHPDRRAEGTRIGLGLSAPAGMTPEEARFIDDQHRRDAGVPNGGPSMVTQVSTSSTPDKPGPAAGLAENADTSRTQLNWLERQAEKLGSDTPEKRKNLGAFLVGFGSNIANSTGDPLQSIATAIGAGSENRILSDDRMRQVAQQDQELAWKKEAMDLQRENAAAARADRSRSLDLQSKADAAEAEARANDPFYGLDNKKPGDRAKILLLAQQYGLDPNIILDYKPPAADAFAGL